MILVSVNSISISFLFQAQEENGETSFVRVEDPNATWLTMLRPAPSESVRNTSVFYKGMLNTASISLYIQANDLSIASCTLLTMVMQ